jgi:beta-xylosidase
MWYGCGQWCVATSEDGLVFSNITLQYSRYGSSDSTDGTGVFIDDDGTGYVIFSSPNHNHSVSIERLSADYLSSTHQLIATLPDTMVESPSLFRRNGIYYATYGSCCCACRAGSGQVVNWALSPAGPWKRQMPHPDINCVDATAQICGEYGPSASKPHFCCCFD